MLIPSLFHNHATREGRDLDEDVPGPVRPIAADWTELSGPGADAPPFDSRTCETLPANARRWLERSIPAGTPLASTVHLTMRGSIRLGRWREFEASQVLSPARGYIWAATARVAGLTVSGYDRFTHGTGEMRWRICDAVPIMSAVGDDVTRSAAGRAAAECVLVPTCFRDAEWEDVDSGDTVATWRYGTGTERVRLGLDGDGMLQRVTMSRWGNPGGGAYGRYPFGVEIEELGSFHGITVPTVIRADWWFGTPRENEGEFFRAEIASAHYR